MKKNRFFWASAAIAALTLTACADQDEFNQNDVQTAAIENSPGAIQFGTYLGQNGTTRAGSAGVITTEKLKLSGYNFGVLAYNTDATPWAGATNAVIPNFMYNEKIYWDGTNWTYNNIKFWPNDYAGNKGYVDEKTTGESGATGTKENLLSFFAYAPWVEFDYDQATPGSDEINSVTRNWLAPDPNTQLFGVMGMTSNNQTSEPYIKYTLTQAASDQAVDLLWGLRGNTAGYDIANGSTEATIGEYNTNLVKQTVNERVNFLFKHALAKVAGHNSSSTTGSTAQTGLQVILDIDKDGLVTGGTKADATLVTVKSVQVRTVGTGDGFNLNGTDGADGSNLATDGWFNIADGKWYNVSIKETSSQYDGATYDSGETTVNSTGAMGKLNADIAEPASLTSPSYVDGTGWKLDGTTVIGGVTTTAKDVYTNDSDVPAILMIPNDQVDQTLLVTIDYIVRTYDDHLAVGASGSDGGKWTKVEQKITNTVIIPKGTLESNKYYKLLMHLGLTSIKFTASVSDWDDVTNTDADGDGDVDDPKDADKDIYLPSNVVSRELAGVETADYSVDVQGTTPVEVPSSTTNFTIAMLNVPAPGEAKDVTVKTWPAGWSGTVTEKGVLNVTATANTTNQEKSNTITITHNGVDYTITVNQTMEMTIAATDITTGETTSTITATVNTANTTSGLTKVKIMDGTTDITSSSNITGTTLTVPVNNTSKDKTITVTLRYTDSNSKTAEATTTFTQAAHAVTATATPTSGLKATVAANRLVTVTVADGSGNIDLTNAANSVTYRVVKDPDGTPVDVTANCTITKTNTGLTVLLPVVSAATDYKIYVTVNDAAEASTEKISQNANDN